ncbi:hypothetical protein DY926_01080 [Komagataeibacter melaceti]|uniref:Uncharacterized protein n=1 Tax=Komagataeibacter melaceti TaxID=2766577 RepID=A0A371Z4C9_9PROT|nr:hypothetical protein [Komagataeibacter melaceti]RFD21342.1 hypothetical protein DY926_01080 [Komagataeibacter melaceti]
MIDHIRRFNDGRTLPMNAGACFCIIVMMGIANLICRFVLKADISYLVPWLVSGTVVYFFAPAFILWFATGSPSGQPGAQNTKPR